MPAEAPYDPLDYSNLTASVVRELMQRDAVPLPPPQSFPGPGVYALFYNGGFQPYASLSSPDWDKPIYVGKAVLPGARKGLAAADMEHPSLYKRLREHSESIQAATNLDVNDFRCRYLVVIPLWITMAERFLIEHYRPPWNVCVEGFGLHNPGAGRHEGEISWWDALHPGRPWARNLRQVRTQEDAIAHLSRHLANP